MTKFYYVYLLVDVATETHRYTGVTEDLTARLAKHNAGEVPHISRFKPWRIQTAIAFDNKEKAVAFKDSSVPDKERWFLGKGKTSFHGKRSFPLPQSPTLFKIL